MMMRIFIFAGLLLLTATEANAYVACAAGAYHAGCVRRPPVARSVAVVRRPVVVPHCRIVYGRRVC